MKNSANVIKSTESTKILNSIKNSIVMAYSHPNFTVLSTVHQDQLKKDANVFGFKVVHL